MPEHTVQYRELRVQVHEPTRDVYIVLDYTRDTRDDDSRHWYARIDRTGPATTYTPGQRMYWSMTGDGSTTDAPIWVTDLRDAHIPDWWTQHA